MSVEVDVRVVPRSSRNRIETLPDGSLKAWLHAPPTDGQANAALCESLAKALRIPKTEIRIVRGETSRTKRLRIEGLELSDLRKRLS